jgi:hypothetical protein
MHYDQKFVHVCHLCVGSACPTYVIPLALVTIILLKKTDNEGLPPSCFPPLRLSIALKQQFNFALSKATASSQYRRVM